jgi:hypothetical protein
VSARRFRRGTAGIAIFAALLTATPAAAQNATPNATEDPASSGSLPELDPDELSTGVTAPAAEQDTIQVPSGGQPFVVTRADAIPRQLKAAVESARCNLTDPLITKYPVLIFRPADGRRLMAVVPCAGATPDSRAFLFDQSVEAAPSPMTFPIAAATGGFSASSQPGLMSWDAQTRTLTAWRGSDQCPAREWRHTYRQGGGELNGFALSKVEHRRLRCTTPEADWLTLWQSPVWKLQP